MFILPLSNQKIVLSSQGKCDTNGLLKEISLNLTHGISISVLRIADGITCAYCTEITLLLNNVGLVAVPSN